METKPDATHKRKNKPNSNALDWIMHEFSKMLAEENDLLR